ncbi:MAG: DNA polymerase III subunit delta [Gammaproteobacteria bacterium]
MKIAAHLLGQQLTKNLSPIYVVSGDEPLLTQEACDLIREAAIAAGFTERVRINVEPGADWGKAFYAYSQSFSLFATKRLLDLDLTTAKLNAASSKILQEYTQQPPSDTILLIRTNKLDSKTEQTSWYKALDKVSVIIPIWPITIEQLPAWILQRAKKLDLNITKSAAELLATLVEGNLLAAAQELEKLRLLQLTEVIDHQTIENAISDHAHFDIFTLVDSALSGNTKRSLRILENLAAEDTEPTLILWAIARELRTLADMAKQIQQGIALGTLFPKFRIWEKRQPSVRAFLQRNKLENCWELLTNAAQIDRIIKGAETGNVWDALGQLVLKM